MTAPATVDQLRRQSVADRLEHIRTTAERYQDEAFDNAEPDEAVRWHVIAAALRGVIAMLEADA